MRSSFSRAAVLALMLCTACASHSPRAAGRRNNDLITQEDIRERHFNDVYAAVEALHSNWLQTHGPDSFSSPTQVIVYMDDSRIGGVDQLRGMSTTNINYIRHYDGISATARWGLDHGNGVIYLSSRPNK